MLRELIADRLSNLIVGLAAQTVRGRERTQIWHGLQIPNNDVSVHAEPRRCQSFQSRSNCWQKCEIVLDDVKTEGSPILWIELGA